MLGSFKQLDAPEVSLVLESSVLQDDSGRCNRPLHWVDTPRCGPLCSLTSSCSPGNLNIIQFNKHIHWVKGQIAVWIYETYQEGSHGRRQFGSVLV